MTGPPVGCGMSDPPVTIRFAHAHDADGLAVLAQLDSAERLVLPALVAEVGGGLLAALSLMDGSIIADPFRPTCELVDLLRTRARQLAAAQPRAGLLYKLKVPLRPARAS